MRKLLFALSAATIVSIACQKEASLEVPDSNPGSGGGGGSTAQGLLTRTAFVAGADSVVTEYTYDASKRLATFTYTSTGGGNQFKRIVRNNAGIMTSYVTKSAELITLNIDSVVTNVLYDNTRNEYKSAVSTLSFNGTDYSDSTAFTFDVVTGNLIKKESFAKVGPALYTAYQKVEYTFGSGNTLSEKYYDINNSGVYELLGTYNYTYDAKLNPIKLGVEGIIVLDDGTYFSNNNVTTTNYVDAADPADNFSLTTTFTYNTADKPAGGTAVETPGSGSYTLRYYYN